jgi:16S rRNA (guanine527-N7)-methyltransferase
MTDPAEAALDGLDVSRETRERLRIYVDTLSAWSKRIDLVGPRELAQIWTRHVADSAQLVRLAPSNAVRWADLGTGAGLPGLIVGILIAEREGAQVDLYEQNGKRCAFLREAIRATMAPAVLHQGDLTAAMAPKNLQIVTARALAPLPTLLKFANPFMVNGATGLFLKGRDAAQEAQAAREAGWMFHVKHHASLTDSQAAVLEISRLEAPPPA